MLLCWVSKVPTYLCCVTSRKGSGEVGLTNEGKNVTRKTLLIITCILQKRVVCVSV